MHVFVTGATGFVGSVVVKELLEHGHRVSGLVRSDDGAASLAAVGAEVVRGSLEDPASLRRGAEVADGVIHCAFNHDFSRFAENAAGDRLAIETIGAALEGGQRPLLVTSGLAHLTTGRAATEADPAPTPNERFPRASEVSAKALADRGVRAAAVRLPPSVHGTGDHGFVPMLIDIARQKGVSAYVDAGTNRWAAVHRLDAARLYRLSLERGAGDGPYHAIGDEGVAFREIAEVIGQQLGLPVVSVSGEAATAHFGWFRQFVSTDMAGLSARTRGLLGWTPTGPGLLSDMVRGGYFVG